jgi:HEAT repeat protein
MSDSGRLPAPIARRQAIALAGHQGDEATARSGLTDPDATVRATALGALVRLSAIAAPDLDLSLADDDPIVRRRLAEVLPATAADAARAALAPNRVNALLRTLLADPDDGVVEVAAWACGEITDAEPATIADVCALATGHRDALVREAAVAALGAIGDPVGLPSILAATSDKPAVRRRAVLALAPFDGPEVDAALARALTDRDWQVRQAAEDLLAE